jgi:hypothetical protein
MIRRSAAENLSCQSPHGVERNNPLLKDARTAERRERLTRASERRLGHELDELGQ